MKNSQGHRTVFLLVKLSIVMALLLVCIEMNWPRAQTSVAASLVSSSTSSVSATDDVEETTTLTSAKLKTWQWNTTWHADHFYCPDLIVGIPLVEVPDGQVATGTILSSDRGSRFLGCPVSRVANIRGSVWFDLSEIVKKAPVYVTSATLNFKKVAVTKYPEGPQVCSGELMIARRDWMKDDSDELLAFSDGFGADPLPIACGSADCSLDVRSTVNNWIKGSEDRYGWVIARRGERPASESDTGFTVSQACLTRYGEFSLTVTYKYKPSLVIIVAPLAPIMQRTNVARGGFASASSTTLDTEIPGFEFHPSAANDGNRSGNTHPKNGFWRDGTDNVWPDYLQIDFFGGSKKIDEIDVFTLQDNFESGPTDPKDESVQFKLYGITDFDVQYWDGSSWQTIESVIGNDKVWRKFTLSPAITTSAIRVFVKNALFRRSRIVELEAWTGG